MNVKKILVPLALLGSAVLLTGCYTPYASGTVGTRVGSGGYVSGSVGGYPYGSPYGYRDYNGGAQVHGYDRNGNPIYRTPDGRLVQGYDPYRNRGVYVTPRYGYPSYPYPGYGYPGYGSYPRYNYPPPVYRHPPRGQHPSRPGGGNNNHGPGTPPPVATPRPLGNSSPLGNVVREERLQRDRTRGGLVREQEP